MRRRLQSQSTEATTGFRGENKRVCHSTWELRGFQKVANCLVRELGMKHLSQGERGSDEDRLREREGIYKWENAFPRTRCKSKKMS